MSQMSATSQNLRHPTDDSAGQGNSTRNDLFIAISKVIDQDIRPYVQADGGDIELVAIDGIRVKVRLLGACGTCPSSLLTLRDGVQTRLRARIAPDLLVEEIV